MERGYGICLDKSHLLVALARAGGIPARYCLLEQPNRPLRRQSSSESEVNAGFAQLRAHPLVELRLRNGWLSLDPTLGDAEAAGLGLVIPRFGFDPIMQRKVSGNIIARQEELAADRHQRMVRRFFCVMLCKGDKCANQLMNDARKKGRQLLAEIGISTYIRQHRHFYVPLPGQ